MSGRKLKRVTTFPRQVVGGAGIDVEKQNGNFTISLDYAEFGLHSPYVPAPSHRVVIFAQGTSGYFTVPTSVLSALGDSQWSNVKLLMGFEGVNGSTGAPGFTDESLAAHGTATVGGATQISTAVAKFGGSSASFSTVPAAGASFASSADWQFGNSQFTMEGWINPSTSFGTGTIIALWNATGNQLSWLLFAAIGTDNKLHWDTSTNGSTINADIIGATSLSTGGVWYAWAIDFDGSKYRLYLNGVMDGSFSTVRNLFPSTATLTIGVSNNSANNITAFMDEIRITKGVARYASDGGYTVPTTAFPRHS
jgi:hypothetical protein